MLSDGGVWQRGGDAGEADGGDGIARRPAVIRIWARFRTPHQQIREDLREEIIPLFRGYRWLHHTKIDENCVCRESRDVVEVRHLHRGPLGAAVAAGRPAKGAGIQKKADVAIFANIQRKATTTANVIFAGGRNSARGSGVVRRCTQQPAKSQYKCI
jgi:hypothetical protein